MADHAPDRPAEFGGPLGLGLDPHDLPLHPLGKRLAQLGAVVVHPVQFGADLPQHPLGDLRAHRPADQPAALLANPLLDRCPEAFLLLRHQHLELRQHEAEHLLVASALDQVAQGLRH